MLIVEGPDGAGKSQLIARLKLQRVALKSLRGGLGGDLPEGWGTDGDPFYSYLQILNRSSALVAFDRFHLSERVYGPLLRSEQLIDDACLEAVNWVLHKRRIPIILCLPPFEETLANVSHEGRPRPAYQTPSFLQQAYDEFTRLKPWATIVFDYTKDELPKVL